ncbi:pyridoxal phosphate-dependent decarboxylase family protein [Glutamicibacter endophyticus]
MSISTESLPTAPPAPTAQRQFEPAVLDSHSVQDYLLATQESTARVASRFATVSSPTTGPAPSELAAAVNAVDLDSPLEDLREVFDEVHDLYLRDAVYFHDPKYAAHLNCPVLVPAVAAETFVTSLNTSMDTFDQSAGATMIERRLMTWSASLIGFDEAQSDGIFTSGGTQSNLQAMLIARNVATAKCSHGSLADRQAALRIYTSQDAHFSIVNAAKLMGLGPDAVVSVPTDAQHRMDVNALRSSLAADRAAGLVPMAISATAGNTDFGAIDPLNELAELARECGAWFHVDAAYGCGLLVSEQHRQRLSGIDLADSVTLDFHKSFFQPIGSSALVLRDGRNFSAIAHYAEYLNPSSEAQQTPNQVDKSLQTTRRFDALKLWVTLRNLGAARIGQMFDRVIELAEDLEREISLRSDLHLAAPVQLSTVVFWFEERGWPLDNETRNELTNEIRRRLYSSGRAMIAATTVEGQRMLKLTILNPNTPLASLVEILDEISRVGNEILSEHMNEATA